MATTSQNIFLTKKEKLKCSSCNRPIAKGHPFVAESENHKGTCFYCSPFTEYTLLEAGDAAMTRRSKKHSALCAVLWEWNARRKRFQRKGQFVEALAIKKARIECLQDQEKRAEKNRKAAIVRQQQDKEYILRFAYAIRQRYPYCPPKREIAIAIHACEKYSGRVGRTAQAKTFDTDMIDLAVEAHIRHAETDYDAQFGHGKRKKDIRANVKGSINAIKDQWRYKK